MLPCRALSSAYFLREVQHDPPAVQQDAPGLQHEAPAFLTADSLEALTVATEAFLPLLTVQQELALPQQLAPEVQHDDLELRPVLSAARVEEATTRVSARLTRIDLIISCLF